MKKILLLLFFISHTSYCHVLETERTIWLPWTIEHTQQWEGFESNDHEVAHFYRNDFLEPINELIQRDSHWLTLCDKIQSSIGAMMLFPHLGFAIINKLNNKLIGTVRMKLCNTPGELSFGFGLRPGLRNQHFGREILQQLIHLINQSIDLPIAQFKPGITKQAFMEEWHLEGKKTEPDFDHLFSFFHTESHPFKTLIGSVDIMNPSSLSVLIRNKMQPYSIVCSKYIIDKNTKFFSCDFLLQYPAKMHNSKPSCENLIPDMLSRNPQRINNALQFIHECFTVPTNCEYLSVSRTKKVLFKPEEKIVSTLSFTNSDTVKRLVSQSYYPPHCFMK